MEGKWYVDCSNALSPKLSSTLVGISGVIALNSTSKITSKPPQGNSAQTTTMTNGNTSGKSLTTAYKSPSSKVSTALVDKDSTS